MKRSVLVSVIIFILLSLASSAIAAPERRTALVIGNGAYDTGRLRNPVNDATDISTALRKMGFSVILITNARHREMLEAIENFGNKLKRGGVGLFYFAGHGIQMGGANYLLPIGARINKERDVQFEALDAGRILAEMEAAHNRLNIVILDACRDNPFARSFRSTSRGLAIVNNAPVGTFISYSTGAGQVARDGQGRNSPYTQALLQYIQEPGIPINNVFMKVRQTLRKATGQVPWELSSLEGDFYFVPGNRLQVSSSISQEPPSEINETIVYGRFVDNGNETITDTNTKLMWSTKDSGSDINWYDAQEYCKRYRGGGHRDWRMPTQGELAELYASGAHYDKIGITGWVWASDMRSSQEAYYFNFSDGRQSWNNQFQYYGNLRALPVRSDK